MIDKQLVNHKMQECIDECEIMTKIIELLFVDSFFFITFTASNL